jgi:hypothetical protein
MTDKIVDPRIGLGEAILEGWNRAGKSGTPPELRASLLEAGITPDQLTQLEAIDRPSDWRAALKTMFAALPVSDHATGAANDRS